METRENNPEGGMSGNIRAVGDAAATAAQRAGESLNQGRDALVDLQRALAERTRECVESTDIYVRENPWQAVGIAAGIGMIVGLLMSRR